jgi:hypothetical protein
VRGTEGGEVVGAARGAGDSEMIEAARGVASGEDTKGAPCATGDDIEGALGIVPIEKGSGAPMGGSSLLVSVSKKARSVTAWGVDVWAKGNSDSSNVT